eukprot:NODE_391_length_9459_cov_0.222970.p1 type:complete len:1238 gc:universal NODE_391_length_9459_cov_0.222970:2890-6603(+)
MSETNQHYLEVDKSFQFAISNANQYKLRQDFENDKLTSFWKTFNRFTFSSINSFYIPRTPFPMVSTNDFLVIASVEELIIKAMKRQKWYTLHLIPIDIDPFPQFAQIIIHDDKIFYFNSLGLLKVISLVNGNLIYQINLLSTLIKKQLVTQYSKFSNIVCSVHCIISNDQLYIVTLSGHIIWITIKYDLPLLQGIYTINYLALTFSIAPNSSNLKLLVADSIYKLHSATIIDVDLKKLNDLPYLKDVVCFKIPTISVSSLIFNNDFIINNVIYSSDKIQLNYNLSTTIQDELYFYDVNKSLVLLNKEYAIIPFICNESLQHSKIISNSIAYTWQSSSSKLIKPNKHSTWFVKLYSLVFSIFNYLSSIILWQFEPSISTISNFDFTIYSLHSSTLMQMYRSMLSSLNYSKALKLCKELDIEPAEVYKVQWSNTPITASTISILNLISDLEWVLKSCAERVPNNLQDCILLNEYGLRLLDDNAGRNIDDAKYRNIFSDALRRLQYLKSIMPQIPLSSITDPINQIDSSSEFALYFSIFRSYDIIELMQYMLNTMQIKAYNKAVSSFDLSFTRQDALSLLPINCDVSGDISVSDNTIQSQITQNGFYGKLDQELLDFYLSTVSAVELDYLNYSNIQLLSRAISHSCHKSFIVDILNEVDAVLVVENSAFNPDLILVINQNSTASLDPGVVYDAMSALGDVNELLNYDQFRLQQVFHQYSSSLELCVIELILHIISHIGNISSMKFHHNAGRMIRELIQSIVSADYFNVNRKLESVFLLDLYSRIDMVISSFAATTASATVGAKAKAANVANVCSALYSLKLYCMSSSIPLFCICFNADYFKYLKGSYYTESEGMLMGHTIKHVIALHNNPEYLTNLSRLCKMINTASSIFVEYVIECTKKGIPYKQGMQMLQMDTNELDELPSELVSIIYKINKISKPVTLAKTPDILDFNGLEPVEDYVNDCSNRILSCSNDCREYLNSTADINSKVLAREFKDINILQHHLEQCMTFDKIENMRYFKDLLRKYSASEIMRYVNIHMIDRKKEILELFTLMMLRNLDWDYVNIKPTSLKGYIEAVNLIIRNGIPSMIEKVIDACMESDYGDYAECYIILVLTMNGYEVNAKTDKQSDILKGINNEIELEGWVGKMLKLNREFSKESCEELFEVLYMLDIEIPMGVASRYIHEFKEDCYYFGLLSRYSLLNKRYRFPDATDSILKELVRMLIGLINPDLIDETDTIQDPH